MTAPCARRAPPGPELAAREGMRVVTRLTEARLERLRRDLPVRLEIAPLFTNDAGDEVLSFAYAPLEGRP